MGFLVHPLWEGKTGCEATSAQSEAQQHSQLQWGWCPLPGSTAHKWEPAPQALELVGSPTPSGRRVIPGMGSSAEGGGGSCAAPGCGQWIPPPQLCHPRLRAGGASFRTGSLRPTEPAAAFPLRTQSITSCVPRRLTHSREPSGLLFPPGVLPF